MRLVQIGVRGMGNHWVGVGKRSGDVEVVGYVDVVPEHLAQLQKDHGVAAAACYDDVNRALAALHPDAVLIVTPPPFHAPLAIKALEAGCHVLTEKPLADTWANGLAMVDAAARAGKILMVGQNYRYSAPIQTLRTRLRHGDLGRPGQVAIQFFKGPHFGGFREEMPYPLVVDMSIHHFDLIRYILDADPVSVYAESFNPPWSWFKGDASTTVLFEARLAAEPARPVRITYTGSWTTNGAETPWNADWRIYCDDGCIVLQDDRVRVQRRGSEPWEDVAPVEMARQGQDYLLHEFVTAVREGRQPETHGADNLRSIEMVFKTVESIESSKRVALGS